MKMRVGVLMLMAGLVLPTLVSAQMVILVRHAERADGGAPAPAAGQASGSTMQANPDPELSAVGKARAQKLAEMLRDSGVTAIYTTQYIRTKDTAKPLAEALKITPEVVQSRDLDGLVARIKAQGKGTVLVVGHSNSVPGVIKALGGPEFTIADDDYDNLFFLGPGGALTKIRFKP